MPSHSFVILVLTTGAVLCAACGEPEAANQPTDAVVVRDSAGVRIVENSQPEWSAGDGWRVAARPRLVLGGDEAAGIDHLMQGGVRARGLADGRIVVAQYQPVSLRWFSPDGALLASAGQGQGPGEFRYVSFVAAVQGDTVVAFDARLGRWSVFDEAGALVRAVTLDSQERRGLGSLLAAFGPLDALVAHSYTAPEQDAEPNLRFPYTVETVRLEPLAADTVLSLPGAETFFVYVAYPLTWSRSPPFARGAYVAGSMTGFVAGISDQDEVRRFSPTGELTHIIRRTAPLPPVDDRAIDRAMAADRSRHEEEVAGYPPSFPADNRRMIQGAFTRYVDEVRHPSTMPAFSGLMLSRDGILWVRDYHPPWESDAPDTWQVFSPDGRWLGPVEMPAGFTVQDVGPGYVLGIERDEYDVVTVVVYDLEAAEVE
ncbi:MAG: hypothetical protein WEB88_15065 [Gemmatimonadota bacterium]